MDNAPDTLEIAELALTMVDGDFDVVSCASGGAVIERGGGFRPGVLLRDDRMTKMLGKLRQNKGLKQVPALFLAVRVDEASKSEVRDLGWED
ncbi:MAG: hypothetical protein CMH88_15070 [Oceanibulbus sp.]|nr:hypothetical protein [Sulfitobacter sp.]